MCCLLQTYYYTFPPPPSPPPQFRLSVEQEVCSWKKLDLDFELQCIMLLSQVIKTGHTKFGMETTASFNLLWLLPSNSPLARLAEENRGWLLQSSMHVSVICRKLCVLCGIVMYYIFQSFSPIIFLLEKADNYLLNFFCWMDAVSFPFLFLKVI